MPSTIVDGNYQELIVWEWHGGDLGLFFERNKETTQIEVREVSLAIPKVRVSDVLLSINEQSVANVSCVEHVIQYLQVCSLPATLRFGRSHTKKPRISEERQSFYCVNLIQDDQEDALSEISDDCILEELPSSPDIGSRKSTENRISSPFSQLRISNISYLSAPISEQSLLRLQSLTDLHSAAFMGNLDRFRSYLQAPDYLQQELLQPDPNHGQTPLHLAARGGHLGIIRLILEQFSLVEDVINVKDDKGNTALHFAATKSPDVVGYLLHNNATVAVENNKELTALIVAIITTKKDNNTIVRLLLKFGANPNDTYNFKSILHHAVERNLLRIAGALIRAGGRLDLEDEHGTNVFEKADFKTQSFLISCIYFPPTLISLKERSNCMLCIKKLGFGHRSHNCTLCGRICCHKCARLYIERVHFPQGFPGRVGKGKAAHIRERVCKTCHCLLKEKKVERKSSFYSRNFGFEFDKEIYGEILVNENVSGRRTVA